jgi:hypothetical protein
MKTMLKLLLVLLTGSLVSLSAFAASAVGKIESLQSPAWLDRGGLTVPATVGMEVFAGDTVRTGKGARLLVGLAEGSLVRLGENATFELEKAERKANVFTAALNVIEGAFRFTTRAAGKLQARDVSIHVARNATIGIRGTDLWGRGRDDKDIVCLIEGKIDVTGNNNKTLRLDQPLQFFQSTRTAPPEPISSIDPKQLAIWATETDIETGKGVMSGGQWKVIVSGFASRNALLDASRQLRAAGYAFERSGDSALALKGIASEGEANDLSMQLKAGFALPEVKASK